jgi:hypothetical protein
LALENLKNTNGLHKNFLSEEIKIEEVFCIIQKKETDHENIWFNSII